MKTKRKCPYHTFNHWPVFLVFGSVFAAGAGTAVAMACESGDIVFGLVLGAGLSILSLMYAALAIQTRRYKLKWAPIIAEYERSE